MGCCGSSRPLRVVLLGLDGAGKTTILYQLKSGVKTQTVPTNGFNIETIEHSGLTLLVCDISFIYGDSRINLWRYYFRNVNALIYAIDINDTKRYQTSKESFIDTLENVEIKCLNIPILIYANKMDLKLNFNVFEIEKLFNIETIIECEIFLIETGILVHLKENGIVKIVWDYLFYGFKGSEYENKKFYVQKCCGCDGKGIKEGLDWLVTELKNRKT